MKLRHPETRNGRKPLLSLGLKEPREEEVLKSQMVEGKVPLGTVVQEEE